METKSYRRWQQSGNKFGYSGSSTKNRKRNQERRPKGKMIKKKGK
jgi:hypothetical protein